MTAEWSDDGGQTWSAMQRALQVVGLAMFCAVLAAIAAATCVLSYAGIHAVAEQGGIQARYARGYPLLIDAILVIVLAAVLALRGAGLPSRILSWLTLLVLLAAAAGAEALHDTRRALPRDAAAITVAVLPWLLVLVTFVLLLAMLRHARLRRAPSAARTQRAPPEDERARDGPRHDPSSDTSQSAQTLEPGNSVSIVPGFSSLLASAAAAGAAAGRAVTEGPAAGPAAGSVQSAGHQQPEESSLAPGINGVAIGEPASSTSADADEENSDADQTGDGGSPAAPAG